MLFVSSVIIYKFAIISLSNVCLKFISDWRSGMRYEEFHKEFMEQLTLLLQDFESLNNEEINEIKNVMLDTIGKENKMPYRFMEIIFAKI